MRAVTDRPVRQLPMKDLVRCPAAQPVEGSSPGNGGVTCAIMQHDQARADGILEGAPVGVFVSERDDLMQLVTFCCGDGPPLDEVEGDMTPHHTACPIFQAAQEWDGVTRLFPFVRGEDPDEEVVELLASQKRAEDALLTEEEREWMATA